MTRNGPHRPGRHGLLWGHRTCPGRAGNTLPPAQQGGVLLGDILVALDNQPVQDPDDLQALLTGDRVGRAVPVTVLRGGALQTLQITIGERS